MKKIILSLALLALLSCKDDSVKPVNGTEISTETAGDSANAVTEKAHKQSVEDEIIVLQKNITNSTPADRRSLLQRYLSYSDKIDGAVAEIYSLFAYEYEQEHTADFYSVLQDSDTDIIVQWADEASAEIAIRIETLAEAEAFLQDLKHTNEAKITALEPAQTELFNLYHKQLEEKVYNYIQK